MPSVKQLASFFVLNLILCSWHLDFGTNDGVRSRAAAVSAFVHHGTFQIDRYHEPIGDKSYVKGHYYSDKAPLPTLLVIPCYWLLHELGFVRSAEEDDYKGLLLIAGFICGSLPLALILTFVWYDTYRASNRWHSILVMLTLFGSMLFIYSGSFQSHVLGSMFILFGAFQISKRQFLTSGLLAGAAFLTEHTLLLFTLLWTVQLFLTKTTLRSLLHFGLGLLPFVAVALVYNYRFTGDPFSFLYKYAVNFPGMSSNYGFRPPDPEAIWGLTFSQYRGLYFYVPALIWVSVVAARKVRKRARNWVTHPFILPAIILCLTIPFYSVWWGGWSYGPRHLITPTLLFLFLGLRLAIQEKRIPIPLLLLSASGFVFAFVAKCTINYNMPTGVRDPITSLAFPAFYRGEWADSSGVGSLISGNTSAQPLLFLIAFLVGAVCLTSMMHNKQVQPDNPVATP